MKFIFNGSYTTFDGHEFMFGKAVDVTGAGTIEKLLKDDRFTQADEPLAEVYSDKFAAKLCPKCGVKPAKHFHVRSCTGQR